MVMAIIKRVIKVSLKQKPFLSDSYIHQWRIQHGAFGVNAPPVYEERRTITTCQAKIKRFNCKNSQSLELPPVSSFLLSPSAKNNYGNDMNGPP